MKIKVLGAILWAVGFAVFTVFMGLAGNISDTAWIYAVMASIGAMTFTWGIRLVFDENIGKR